VWRFFDFPKELSVLGISNNQSQWIGRFQVFQTLKEPPVFTKEPTTVLSQLFSRFYDFLNFLSGSVSRAAGSENGNHQPDGYIYLYNWSDNRKRTDPVFEEEEEEAAQH